MALESLIRHAKENPLPRGPICPVKLALENLDDSDKTAADNEGKLLAEQNSALTWIQLAEILTSVTGRLIKPVPLSRHYRKICGCLR